MKFGLSIEISFDVGRKLDIVFSISNYLEIELENKNYGKGVTECLGMINCSSPNPAVNRPDFQTGHVIHKKYVKSKEFLQFDVKINYKSTIEADQNNLVNLIAEALLKSKNEIRLMDIKDFDIDSFYNDLKVLIEDRGWEKNPEKYKKAVIPYMDSINELTEVEKMRKPDFWRLIEISRKESKGDINKQIDFITDKLSQKSEKEIEGFELTLRELLHKANDYNVLALAHIIEGSVTEDSFIYFKCKIILLGSMSYNSAIQNPNYFFDKVSSDSSAELLLAISDNAFLKKFGQNIDKELPQSRFREFLNYDLDSEMKGKEWKQEELPKKFSKLWKMYHK